MQKFGYLPESTTDFIYAIVCEELGIGGAIGVLAIFVLLAVSGLAIATATAKVKENDGKIKVFSLVTNYESLIAMGFTLTVTMQALINAAEALGGVIMSRPPTTTSDGQPTFAALSRPAA